MRFIKPVSAPIGGKCVVALGFFDGVHLGHMALIKQCKEKSCELLASSCLYTFDIPPKKQYGNGLVKEITPIEQKKKIIADLGVDIMAADTFDSHLMNMTPVEFVKTVLKEKLNALCVVAGFHYTFGKGGAGNAETLKRICSQEGIETIIIPPVKFEDEIVSSRGIRVLIEKGNVTKAADMMSRPFTISNFIKHGKKIGRTMKVPTINIVPPPAMVVPAFGVYLTCTVIEGENYFGITNVGVRPTIGKFDNITVETHLFDFKQDIYGEWAEVKFLDFIRPETKFSSVLELKNQVEKDINKAQKMISCIIRKK